MMSQVILEFREVESSIIKKIANIFFNLKCVDDLHSYLRYSDRLEENGEYYDSDALLLKINESLLSDYKINSVEELVEPWTFNYVIEKLNPCHVAILTKLFSKDDDFFEGNIYYGAEVIKVKKNKFILWSDYDS